MPKAHEVAISLDGKGCWMGNDFVERLRRNVTNDCASDGLWDAWPVQSRPHPKYFEFYNFKYRHSALDRRDLSPFSLSALDERPLHWTSE